MDIVTYALLNGKIKDYASNVDEWLEKNVDPDTGYVLDRSLQMENAAAPADMVGDISNEVGDLKNTLTSDIGNITGNTIISGWSSKGKYIKTDNGVGSTINLTEQSYGNQLRYVIINCSAGDQFTISGHGDGEARLYCFIDSSNICLSVAANNLTANNLLITAPTNAAKLILNDIYNDNSYKNELIIKKVDTIYQNIGSAYAYEETKQLGYMNYLGIYRYPESFCSITRKFTGLNVGDKIIYRGIGQSDAYCAVLFNSAGTAVDWRQGNYLTTDLIIEITGDIKSIWLSSMAAGSDYDNVFLYASLVGSDDIISKVENIGRSFSNYLYNKKWVACGDSFTAGSFDDYTDSEGHTGINSDAYDKQWKMYKTYPWWIARRNGMQLINEAVSGSTMALPNAAHSGMSTSPFSDQRYQQIPADADYITLWFDINDQGYCDLGTINDTTNATTYGAWNVVMEWLITNRPWAKIGIIVTNAIHAGYLEFAAVARDIARKWGVGYLDLQQDYTVPLTLDINTRTELCDTAKNLRNSQYYVSSNNHHPSLKAHEYQSTFIENWLRSL